MNEKINPLAFRPPRLHGHVALELLDERGRVKQRTETDNYVTDAVGVLANNVAGGSAEIGTYLMPIATKALGGLMLFDETLGSNATKYDFPAGSAKLLGYALQDTNTTNTLRGSLVSSAAVSGGWRTEWEFLPSQANGTIKAACLTNAAASPLDGFAGTAHTLLNDSGTALNDNSTVIYYDADTGTVYYAGGDSFLKGSGVGSGVLTLNIYKERLATSAYKVGDTPNTGETATLSQTLSVTLPLGSYKVVTPEYESGTGNTYPSLAYAGIDENGKVWFVWSVYNNPNGYPDGYCYLRLAFSGGLFSVDGTDLKTIAGERPHYNASVSGDRLYMQTSSSSPAHNAPCDRLLVVDVNNLADVTSVDLPTGYTFSGFMYPNYAAIPCGGGLLIKLTKSGDYYGGTYSPTKGLTIDGETSAFTSRPFYRAASALQSWNFGSGYGYQGSSGAYVTNYLGTVSNLTTPVIKTAADTLRVVYTLTDA